MTFDIHDLVFDFLARCCYAGTKSIDRCGIARYIVCCSSVHNRAAGQKSIKSVWSAGEGYSALLLHFWPVPVMSVVAIHL
jgi:hypothetical protein